MHAAQGNVKSDVEIGKKRRFPLGRPFEPDPAHTGVGKRHNFRFSETVREAVTSCCGFLHFLTAAFTHTKPRSHKETKWCREKDINSYCINIYQDNFLFSFVSFAALCDIRCS
jgi:hypothetical protein